MKALKVCTRERESVCACACVYESATYLTHVSNPDASVILGCDSAGYCKEFLYVLVTFRKILMYLCILYSTTRGIHGADEGQSARNS